MQGGYASSTIDSVSARQLNRRARNNPKTAGYARVPLVATWNVASRKQGGEQKIRGNRSRRHVRILTFELQLITHVNESENSNMQSQISANANVDNNGLPRRKLTQRAKLRSYFNHHHHLITPSRQLYISQPIFAVICNPKSGTRGIFHDFADFIGIYLLKMAERDSVRALLPSNVFVAFPVPFFKNG